MAFRKDLVQISSWIKPNTKVLDLGCGSGELLRILQQEKNIEGYGIDNDINNIKMSLKNNINILQFDLDNGLKDFESNSFDYVVLAQSLQVIKNPQELIKEMRRIGKEIIVSFPNMGHWSSRLQLLFRGMMPITQSLPFKWHDTPNIHLCTIEDFLIFCKENNLNIEEVLVTNHKQQASLFTKIAPNFFGQIATFRIR